MCTPNALLHQVRTGEEFCDIPPEDRAAILAFLTAWSQLPEDIQAAVIRYLSGVYKAHLPLLQEAAAQDTNDTKKEGQSGTTE